jgi:hypothetical protein
MLYFRCNIIGIDHTVNNFVLNFKTDKLRIIKNMKQLIADLKVILSNSEGLEAAAKELSKSEKRLSKKAATNVLRDVQDFEAGVINESQLSLYLIQHGFKIH